MCINFDVCNEWCSSCVVSEFVWFKYNVILMVGFVFFLVNKDISIII